MYIIIIIMVIDIFYSRWKYFTNPLNSSSEMRKSYSFTFQNRYIWQKKLKWLFLHYKKSDSNGFQNALT